MNRNIRLETKTDVRSVADQEAICASLGFAGCVLEDLPVKENFRE